MADRRRWQAAISGLSWNRWSMALSRCFRQAASFDNLSSAHLAEFAKLFKPSGMDLLSFGANGFIAAGFDGADESPGVITNGW